MNAVAAIKPYAKYIVWLIVALVLFMVLKKYVFTKRPDPADIESDMSLVNGVWVKNKKGTPTGFDPTPITDALKADIYSYGTRDSSPYQAALKLSNAQLGEVYNDWNKRYYRKDKETLLQAIKGEFSFWASTTVPMELLVEKLQQMGLS